MSGVPDPSRDTGAGSLALVFGRYQILRRLAVGGMGEVFLAMQTGVAGFQRHAILKSLLPELATQEDSVDEFLDEARVAATLNHPNIVSIFEVGLWNGTYFMAMEYIAGENLARLQRAAQRAGVVIEPSVAVLLIHDAAIALDHAHRATDVDGRPLGIVHRDVSPQNIMVRTDGVAKVVDFGIAKAANRNVRTATGLIKGKVQYMSPEQVRGEVLDARTDQFALGIVLWELLSGQRLFSAASEIDVLRAVLRARIPPLDEVLPGCSPTLACTVGRMLERDREARFPTMQEAASALAQHLAGPEAGHVRQRAAQMVERLLGDEISGRTVGVTPSHADNFVIQLQGGASQTAGVPRAETVRGARRRSVVKVVAAAVGIAAGVSAVMELTARPEPASAGPLVVAAPQAAVLVVTSNPAGATVNVDGSPVGVTPSKVENLAVGVDHSIAFALEGHVPAARTRALTPGETAMVHVDLTALPATLRVTSTPSGATVRAVAVGDNVAIELGVTPIETTLLRPGAWTLSLALLQGATTWNATRDVTIAAAATTIANVSLAPAAEACPPGSVRVAGQCRPGPTTSPGSKANATPAARPAVPAGSGEFTLRTRPWAKVYIDGVYIETTPIQQRPVAAGTHTLRLVNEGASIDETRTIVIRAGQSFKEVWQLGSGPPSTR